MKSIYFNLISSRYCLGILSIFWVLTLSACGAQPTKQFVDVPSSSQPPLGKALIVVKREASFVHGGNTFPVFDNSTEIGQLSNGGTLTWVRYPGLMDLQLRPFLVCPGYQPGGMRVIVEPNKSYTFLVDGAIHAWTNGFAPMPYIEISGPGTSIPDAGMIKEEFRNDWSQFRRGMSDSEVKAILGKYDPIIPSGNYSSGGQMELRTGGCAYELEFINGVLTRWELRFGDKMAHDISSGTGVIVK